MISITRLCAREASYVVHSKRRRVTSYHSPSRKTRRKCPGKDADRTSTQVRNTSRHSAEAGGVRCFEAAFVTLGEVDRFGEPTRVYQIPDSPNVLSLTRSPLTLVHLPNPKSIVGQDGTVLLQ